MKILHVIPYFAAAYGGPVQAVRNIARMQAESGMEVEVATTTANGAAELKTGEQEPAIDGRVRVHYFERSFPRGWFASAHLRSWLRRHAADYDGLHLHVPFTGALHSAVVEARRAGVPYAITPHGVFDPWSLAHKRWKKAPYLALIERTHLAHARYVHVTSELEARGLSALGIEATLRQIPLAVTPPEAVPHRDGGTGLRLLFLSRLHPVKNVPALLRAVAQLRMPDLRLTIAGDGEARFVDELRHLTRDLGISTAVDFAGHLNDTAKLKAWQSHDVFVLPSLHENFSLSTVEAMAAGMPVIVSNQVGVANRVAATGAGLVVAGNDVAALAAAIVSLRDETSRQRAGSRARALVNNEFSARVIGPQYAAFAGDLVRKN